MMRTFFSYFVRSLSIISDTTIAATKSCGCEMNDKFKMNFLIALPAAILSLILYAVFGSAGVAEQNYTYSIIKILPYIVTVVVLIFSSLRNNREKQPPAALGVPYFREER